MTCLMRSQTQSLSCKNVGTKNHEVVKVGKKTNKPFFCFTAVIVLITLSNSSSGTWYFSPSIPFNSKW